MEVMCGAIVVKCVILYVLGEKNSACAALTDEL
jgi:hypothetical protein